MPIEILELIVRARIQQNGTENQAQPGNGQSSASSESQAGAPGNSQLQPTVEEIINDVLKRRQER